MNQKRINEIKAEALREAASRLIAGTALMQTANGITWIPRDSLVGAGHWLRAEAKKLES